MYSDSVKSSFKILSQGLFQRALTGFAITRKAAVMHSGNELEDTPACRKKSDKPVGQDLIKPGYDC